MARAARQPAPPEEPVPFVAEEPPPSPHLPPESPAWEGEIEDARYELRFRALAIPGAMLGMYLLLSTGFGHALLRIFLVMWVHEAGHAITAWLLGFPAFPGPWVTSISPARSPLFALAVAAGLGFWIFRSWRSGRCVMAGMGGALLALQIAGTLLVPMARAQALITFGGDAGCLVLGSLLMATFYVGREHAIHQGWLRWGFLVIGAAAFMDAFALWWVARGNVDVIPFGENEGVGLSDPSKLTEVYGWSVTQLVRRYTWLGCTCLAALGALYGVGLRQARKAVRALERPAS